MIFSAPLAPRRGIASPIVNTSSSRSILRLANSEGNLPKSLGTAIRCTNRRRAAAVAAAAAAAAAASTSSPSPSPSPSTATPRDAPAVVLTREAGKNGKLAAALAQRGLSTLELPLVQTAEGPDADALPGFISEAAKAEEAGAAEGASSCGKSYEWIIVTSPESASVFVGGWKAAGSPNKGIRVAAVGTGTSRALSAAGFSPRVEFTPSVANAVTLARELPFVKNGCRRVLYPASSKAGSDLQDGLAARGFEVDRLNTYTTLPVPRGELPAEAVAAARNASVVALASPSAAKAWLEVIAGSDPNSTSSSSSSSSSSAVCGGVAAACIGSTTADAARKAGFERVFAPEEPGLAGFVEAVVEALEERRKKKELLRD